MPENGNTAAMTKGRKSFLVQVGRTLQKLPLAWLRILLEVPLVMLCRNSKPRMIILLGLPRSGSTLTYQVLIHSLRPHYLSNFGNLLFQLPLTSGLVSAYLCRNHHSTFKSNQGMVDGLCGPAEGLAYWRYWYGFSLDEREEFQSRPAAIRRRKRYLNRVLSILSSNNRPVVTGYLGHTLAASKVRQEFPEAVIVRLHRDPLSNAISLLQSRRAQSTSWFSLYPKECLSSTGRGEYDEVASQVYWLNRRLDKELSDSNVFHCHYEELCKNPSRIVEDLVTFCNKRGMTLSIKNTLPLQFSYRELSTENDSVDAVEIRRALNELETAHGPLSTSQNG
jgi:hypothetical protein